jgi:hypothetical protein
MAVFLQYLCSEVNTLKGVIVLLAFFLNSLSGAILVP